MVTAPNFTASGGNLLDHGDGSVGSHASRSLKSLCVLVWHGAGVNEHRAAWRATWCSGGEAFALIELFLEMATARGGHWPARAAHVAVLASTGRRRRPSVRATHRLRRKSLRGLDGIAVDASSVWQLQAVVVLGLRRASRGWHEQ